MRDWSRKDIGGIGGSSDASLSEDESSVEASSDGLISTFEPVGLGCIPFRTLRRFAIK